MDWEFPDSLVVRIRPFNCHGLGSIPHSGWETKISQATQCNQNLKKKQDGLNRKAGPTTINYKSI